MLLGGSLPGGVFFSWLRGCRSLGLGLGHTLVMTVGATLGGYARAHYAQKLPQS
jgi:hypothetical protein